MLKRKVLLFKASAEEVIQQISGAKENINIILKEIKILRKDIKYKVREGLSKLSIAAEYIFTKIINKLGAFYTQIYLYSIDFYISS